MQWAIPFYSGWHEFSGLVVVDLDCEKIIHLVARIRVGENGYAFLVDRQSNWPIREPCFWMKSGT